MFTLNEARAAIADKPEFKLNEREFGFVIDYMLTTHGTFIGEDERTQLILKNLRGTCFNKAGEIIRLAFHKFHNLNENPEYDVSNFNFNEPHKVQMKLDGSMIAPIPFPDGSYRLGTRAGVTDVAEKATRLMASFAKEKFEAYDSFIRRCINLNLTPIFEFCSREQRIVIDYEESKLVLLDVRDMSTGQYVAYDSIGSLVQIDVVEGIETNDMNIAQFAEAVRDVVGTEGVVIKFNDGRYVKIKGADYCMKHKALDGLRFEKDVLALVLSGSLDDVLPLVDADTKRRLVDYNESVLLSISTCQQSMTNEFNTLAKLSNTRAEFAELVKASRSLYKAGLFTMYSGKPYTLTSLAEKGTSSSSALEEVRWLVGKSFYDFK